MDIETFKKNPKTQYLAQEYERLSREETNVVAMTASDPEIAELGKEELEGIRAQMRVIRGQMEGILEASKEEEEKPKEIILEVRAGAGGEEAAIFAEDLAMMYEKFAEKKGWGWSKLDESRSEMGGYKEASLRLKARMRTICSATRRVCIVSSACPQRKSRDAFTPRRRRSSYSLSSRPSIWRLTPPTLRWSFRVRVARVDRT